MKSLLSCSDPESLTLRELLELADEETKSLWENLALGYTESTGLPQLRREVAQAFYTRATPEDVLLLTPEEGVYVAMRSILRPGDHVIAPFPGYQSLYEIARAIGCVVHLWKVSPPSETPRPGWKTAYSFDLDFVEKTLSAHPVKMIVFNFPHNPTGATPTTECFARLLDLAAKSNAVVFSDEMYRFLDHPGPSTLSPLPSASDLYPRAISLFGLSKSFGLPGLRLGWVVTRDKGLMEGMVAYKDYTTICNSATSEILALMAIRAREKIFRKHINVLTRNLALWNQFVKRHPDLFGYGNVCGGTICFGEWLPGTRGGIPFARVSLDMVEKKSLMMLPSTVYDFGENHFRLGFGRQNFAACLEVLEDYLRTDYPRLLQTRSAL